jgi:ATP-dependent Clp protease ATP-binding subunit ClpA
MLRLGDDNLGTEHVLLGILGNEDGAAVRMLGRLGVALEALEEAQKALEERQKERAKALEEAQKAAEE